MTKQSIEERRVMGPETDNIFYFLDKGGLIVAGNVTRTVKENTKHWLDTANTLIHNVFTSLH